MAWSPHGDGGIVDLLAATRDMFVVRRICKSVCLPYMSLPLWESWTYDNQRPDPVRTPCEVLCTAPPVRYQLLRYPEVLRQRACLSQCSLEQPETTNGLISIRRSKHCKYLREARRSSAAILPNDRPDIFEIMRRHDDCYLACNVGFI